MKLKIRVTPKSGRDEVVGWREGSLWVRVTAVPEKGKATSAACALIASKLGIPKSAVRLERGVKSRQKMLSLEGVSASDVEEAFGRPQDQ